MSADMIPLRPDGDAAGEVWDGGPADVAAAARIAECAFRSPFREGWTMDQIAAALTTAGAWLALAGASRDRPLGFALARTMGEEAELLLCAVEPAAWRHGVGRLLVALVRQEAARRGAQRLLLEVRDGNLPALAFYQAEGFRAVGRRPAYYRAADGRTADALTMMLPLA